MSLFEIQPYDHLGKRVQITGPGDLTIYVDTDDVDREQVEQAMRRMVGLLNTEWDRQNARTFIVTLPEGITIGDLIEAGGAMLGAATTFIDWDALYDGAPDAISMPGKILLDLGRQLDTSKTTHGGTA